MWTGCQGPVPKGIRCLFHKQKSADVYIEQIIGVFHDSKEEYGCISFNKQSELSGKMYDVMPDFTGKVIQSSILTD